MTHAPVRVEHDGPVTIVTIDRREVSNAVDRPTAEALADAFRAFDADADARVGVLAGDHGTFCAGADLKAIAAGPRPTGSRPTATARWVRAGWSWASR